ncbi:MAG: PorV/PorQ family protein [Candidatus Neomarinimicrobiota bacterium]
MNRKIQTIFLIILLNTICSYAQNKSGTASGQFLQIPVGGKAIAMGGAFTALSDDPTALFWNPGAISRTIKNKMYVSQTNWLVGSKHQFLAAQLRFTDQDVIGVCFNLLDYGEREEITTVDQPDGTGEFWEASDLAVSIAYARNLTDRFSIGGSVKYISQKILHVNATTLAVDLGLLFKTQFNGLQIGDSMRNFGGELQMQGRDLITQVDLDKEASGNNETIVSYLKTDKWPIPLTFTVGVAMPIISNKLIAMTLAGDVVRPTDNSQVLNCGADILVMKMISLRAGYQALFRETKQQGLTAGMGLKLPIQYADIIFDYTYQEYGFFGNISTLSLTIGF